MDLHRLDCLSSNRNLETYEFVKEFVAKTPAEVVRPPKLLTGTDLLEAGYRPGPLLGKILATVEEAQLNGELGSTEEAKSYVEAHFADAKEI